MQKFHGSESTIKFRLTSFCDLMLSFVLVNRKKKLEILDSIFIKFLSRDFFGVESFEKFANQALKNILDF
jgi:hypothetical protein